MGDRANLTLKYPEGEVNVYVHWLGSELPTILANALDRGRDRWRDESYLARVIVSQIVFEAGIGDVTGVGIQPTNLFGEGGPVVDLERSMVLLDGDWGGDSSRAWSQKIADGLYTFEEYIGRVRAIDGDPWRDYDDEEDED